MKTYKDLIQDCLPTVGELMPWDLEERIEENPDLREDQLRPK